ncbi:MAG: RDD family protein [Nocardioides sp.]
MSENQPPSYGQPSYGDQGQAANPYGAAAPGGYAPVGAANYAHWGKRVGGHLVDWLLFLPGYIISTIGQIMSASAAADGESSGAGLMLNLIGSAINLGIFIWNVCLKQGKTGQTVGKGVLGIKLVSEETGQPIGGLMSFVRQIVHILDAIACLIGYLWPLWDAKRQTFADKILKTVVVEVPK